MNCAHRTAVGLLFGFVMLLTPFQMVDAAKLTSAQACSEAHSNYHFWKTRIRLQGLKQACKGKAADAIAKRLTPKLNKRVGKANKVHAKVDCIANQDPDSTSVWPKPAASVEEMAAELSNPCDGI